jgi:type I restriction enzyme M protein
MAIKKSELYSSLWASCDALRGGMDASQYKDYVLVLLFVKYVSDKYAGQKDALLDVPKGGSFADMVAAKGDKEIGDKMNKIIAKLAEANDLKGVIDVADFNNEDKLGRGKEMVDRSPTWLASLTSRRSISATTARRAMTSSAMLTSISCATSPQSRARARGNFTLRRKSLA